MSSWHDAFDLTAASDIPPTTDDIITAYKQVLRDFHDWKPLDELKKLARELQIIYSHVTPSNKIEIIKSIWGHLTRILLLLHENTDRTRFVMKTVVQILKYFRVIDQRLHMNDNYNWYNKESDLLQDVFQNATDIANDIMCALFDIGYQPVRTVSKLIPLVEKMQTRGRDGRVTSFNESQIIRRLHRLVPYIQYRDTLYNLLTAAFFNLALSPTCIRIIRLRTREDLRESVEYRKYVAGLKEDYELRKTVDHLKLRTFLLQNPKVERQQQKKLEILQEEDYTGADVAAALLRAVPGKSLEQSAMNAALIAGLVGETGGVFYRGGNRPWD